MRLVLADWQKQKTGSCVSGVDFYTDFANLSEVKLLVCQSEGPVVTEAVNRAECFKTGYIVATHKSDAVGPISQSPTAVLGHLRLVAISTRPQRAAQTCELAGTDWKIRVIFYLLNVALYTFC